MLRFFGNPGPAFLPPCLTGGADAALTSERTDPPAPTPDHLAGVGPYLTTIAQLSEDRSDPMWHSYGPLNEALGDLKELRKRFDRDELEDRRLCREDFLRSDFFSEVTPRTMGTLLCFQPTVFSRRVGMRFLTGQWDLKSPDDPGTIGGFLAADQNDGRPALLAPAYEASLPAEEKGAFFEKSANTLLHAAAHVFQALRQGPDWPGWINEHLEIAEGEAIAHEAAFRLFNGDAAFCDRILLFNPLDVRSAFQTAVHRAYQKRGLPPDSSE